MADSLDITARQWDLVCFIEEFWGEYKGFPPYEVILKSVPNFKNIEEVESEVFSPAVKKRLDNRGIDLSVTLKNSSPDWKNPSRLSDKQLAVINTLLNPYDNRSQTKKLAELGIAPPVLYGWMKQRRFAQYYAERAEELFGDAQPIAHEALVRKVVGGNIGAIKLFYEVSGRHTGNNEEITNFKLLFARFTEILQRHVSPEVMRQIIIELNEVAPVAEKRLNG